MYAARTGALKPLRQLCLRRSGKRWAHDHHGGAHAETAEGFGRSFYLLLAFFPTTYLTYQVSRPRGPNEPHPWTQLIDRYSDWRDEWVLRNARHTKLVEQAGRDRNLFLNSPMPVHIDLGMPELIQQVSPINVPAGHGSADISKLIAYYRDKQFKEEAEKLKAMKESSSEGKSA